MARLDLSLAFGSLEHVNARAVVLGVYRHVDPEGAAFVVDRALGGALRQVVARRMFPAETGTVFMLPAARSGLRTEYVLLAGLGAFDRFDPAVLETVGANVVRTLLCSNVEDFATVLIGAGSGVAPRACLQRLLGGFAAGLDEQRRVDALRVTFCEIDRGRYRAMTSAAPLIARRLSAHSRLEVTVRRLEIEASVDRPGGRTDADRAPAYLLVRQESRRHDRLVLASAVLTAGAHAAIASERMHVDGAALQAHLRALEERRVSPARLAAVGAALAALTLPRNIRRQLATLPGHHLAVVHDVAASRIPWEALRIGARTPALDAGMSRRYTAANLSIARWVEPRRRSTELRMLLIENPTGDLEHAEKEAARIRAFARRQARLQVTALAGRRATRAAVIDALRSEAYDVLHYAGHAAFDDQAPARSGLRCADGILSSEQLLGLRALPALVFFNACETARLSATVGFAETLLRAGVANYVGTYWPVADRSARLFSGTFYRALLSGETVAGALVAGRRAVRRRGAADAIDWADYIHYGSPAFRIKHA